MHRDLQKTRPAVGKGATARSRWALPLTALAVIGVAVAFRMWRLGNIPGINGDEAWYGVQAVKMSRGVFDTFRTPSGLPLNPFYIGPLTVLHFVFEPSFTLLRSVAVASGVLALVVNFFFCRRVLGRTTAWFSTMILATLPINIAYSRFGWDQSQGLLFTLPVIYCSLAASRGRSGWWKWLLAGTLAQIAAMIVHPTNVFVAPFLLVATVIAKSAKPPHGERGHGPWRVFPFLLLVLAAGAIVGAVLRGQQETAQFFVNVERLFTGVTVYRYITGSFREIDIIPRTFDAFDMVGSLIFIAMFGLLARFVWKRGRRAELCLLTGSLSSVIGMFLIVQAEQIGPHFERYAICLIAPLSLLISRAVAVRFQSSSQPRVWLLAFSAACGILLTTFASNYFVHFLRTGGRSHAAFRTGEFEPKEAVVRYRVDKNFWFVHAPSGYSTAWPEWKHADYWIVCDGWWTYWPIAYLAERYDNIHVVSSNELAMTPAFESALERGDVMFVFVQGGEDESKAMARMNEFVGDDQQRLFMRGSPFTYAEDEVLAVYTVRRKKPAPKPAPKPGQQGASAQPESSSE